MLPIWYHCALSLWEQYALAERVSNLKCSIWIFQTTGVWFGFLVGLGREIFLKLKGDIISDPPPESFFSQMAWQTHVTSSKHRLKLVPKICVVEIGSKKLPAIGKVHPIQTLVNNFVLNKHTKVTATNRYENSMNIISNYIHGGAPLLICLVAKMLPIRHSDPQGPQSRDRPGKRTNTGDINNKNCFR